MRIWVISDGKPGHYNQTLGLAEGLVRVLKEAPGDIEVVEIGSGNLRERWNKLKAAMATRGEETPDFVIGAGSRTHLAVLYLARKSRAKSVVCMRPGLPWGWFDFVVVPQHDLDAGHGRRNVITTQGALNRVLTRNPGEAPEWDLILIGGPSKEYGWDAGMVISQLRQALEIRGGRDLPVILTTSRRTPAEFVAELERARLGIKIVPVEETGSGWVAAHLLKARRVWVTRESVSMIYEALSSGAYVGLLDMPLARAAEPGRVGRGINRLREHGKVGTVDSPDFFCRDAPACVLQEATRVAGILAKESGFPLSLD